MAFTYWPWIDRAARIGAVVGTTALLIATSAVPPDPQICLHEEEQIRLRLEGTCGPAATITIVSRENECPIAVLNAPAAKVPPAGRFDEFEGTRTVSLRSDPWTISGYLVPEAPDGGGSHADAMQAAPVSVNTRDAGDDARQDGAPADLPDAAFIPPGVATPSALEASRHCKIIFDKGVPQTLACYASAAQMKDGAATCTAAVTESTGQELPVAP